MISRKCIIIRWLYSCVLILESIFIVLHSQCLSFSLHMYAIAYALEMYIFVIFLWHRISDFKYCDMVPFLLQGGYVAVSNNSSLWNLKNPRVSPKQTFSVIYIHGNSKERFHFWSQYKRIWISSTFICRRHARVLTKLIVHPSFIPLLCFRLYSNLSTT